MGAAWYVIKDAICLPHGTDTFFRMLLSYGLLGGLIMATLVHPVNFVYGFAAGAIAGGYADYTYHPNYPKNF
jgi:hypothetical protein